MDFGQKHIEAAQKIAALNYNEERASVPALPHMECLPGLEDFAAGNRGVAALDGDELVGFFCWHKPFNNLFGLSKGAWSPVHAHGAISRNRSDICDRLYQSVAKILVADNVLSHSITLYEHDTESDISFRQNGFGRRCVDAMRETTPIAVPVCEGMAYRQAVAADSAFLTAARNSTSLHLSESPMFMPFIDRHTVRDTVAEIESGERQYFIATANNRPAAYYCIARNGESFASEHDSVMNICGAYTLPEFRGKGVAAGLLSWLMDWLRERGYTRCGVDYECFNYTGRKFWGKYFAPYTQSRSIREPLAFRNPKMRFRVKYPLRS